MKVNRLNLIQDMNKALPGIATGTVVLENADTVVFNNGHIYSYNSAISVDVAEKEASGLKGVVKGIDFYNCLTKLPGDEIELEATAETWNITDGTIKVKINLLPEGKLFERFDSLKPNETWTEIDSEDFSSGLHICNMPKNSSKFAGIYFKGNNFVSTDSYTINRFTAKNNYPEFWINNSAVAELLKWNNFVAIELNKMWLQLKSDDGTVFSVRTLDTSGFPLERIIEVLNKSLEIVPDFTSEFTEEFYTAINRAAAFSSEDEGHEIVCFNVGTEGSVVNSERISGAYEERITSIKSDNPINLKLDVQTIQDCSTYFSKFKVITRGENKNLLLETENAVKQVATVC